MLGHEITKTQHRVRNKRPAGDTTHGEGQGGGEKDESDDVDEVNKNLSSARRGLSMRKPRASMRVKKAQKSPAKDDGPPRAGG
jgi:hypothetical protein